MCERLQAQFIRRSRTEDGSALSYGFVAARVWDLSFALRCSLLEPSHVLESIRVDGLEASSRTGWSGAWLSISEPHQLSHSIDRTSKAEALFFEEKDRKIVRKEEVDSESNSLHASCTDPARGMRSCCAVRRHRRDVRHLLEWSKRCLSDYCRSSKEEEQKDEAGWTASDVCNASNALSAARLVSSPIIATLLIHDETSWALLGASLAGFSDWLDGYVAKRWKQQSILGSYLDPLADKALVGCLAAALCYKGTISPWLLQATIARDSMLVAASFVHRSRSFGHTWPGCKEFFRIKPGQGSASAPAPYVKPLLSSKINTALQMLLLLGCMTYELWEIPDIEELRKLEYAVGATTGLSFLAYVRAYRKGRILVS